MKYSNQTENNNAGGESAAAQALQANQVAVQNQLGNNDPSLAQSAVNNNVQQVQTNQVVESGTNALGGANSGGRITSNQDVNKQINDGGAGVNTFTTSHQ